ncbi:MAG TPA: serpin family protein [Streptosporangiaceae bacterium]
MTRVRARRCWPLAVGIAVSAGLALAGCGSGSGSGSPGGPAASPSQPAGVTVAHGVAAREPAVSPRPLGAADTAFGLSVLGAWCHQTPRANLVLSPSSLASGLGMAYLGAGGATAQAMARVLHLPATGPRLAAQLQARSAALRSLDRAGVTVASSDQVWTDPGLVTRRSYLNAVATGYRAGVARVPLRSDPGRAAQQIDQAIAAATRGHIPRLLSAGALHDIGWVLTDALYLKAAWAHPFQASATRSRAFRTAAGRAVPVKFMTGGQFRPARAAGWTAVSLPYRGGRLAMLALLPPAGAGGGCALPSAATMASLTGALASGAGGGGAAAGPGTPVALPRVNLSTKAELKDLLAGLGMGVAFTTAADFRPLSPQACCIGLVEHAATLQVGEKGTVASAATAVGLMPTAAQADPSLVFDRPYLLLVTDTSTGEPLFLARVTDPSAR